MKNISKTILVVLSIICLIASFGIFSDLQAISQPSAAVTVHGKVVDNGNCPSGESCSAHHMYECASDLPNNCMR